MKYKIILSVILLAVTGHVCACKCSGPGTVKEDFNRKDLVIYGNVISKVLVAPSQTIKEGHVQDERTRLKDDKRRLYFFDIDFIFEVKVVVFEKFKGENVRDTVTIYTAMKDASCGFPFEKDKSYIIYASRKSYMDFAFLPEQDRNTNLEKENTYWTTHCSRTTEFNKLEAEELRV